MEEYSSGYYKVPSVGAGTANTEFESITGMSMHYFGPGEYPYKGILEEETCESAAYVLKDLGYGTHAIHNNEANFYGRRRVFANLGFDTFTSSEYMSEQDDTNPNDWIRDRNLTKYILQAMESTEGPDYVYTISVQGHGGLSGRAGAGRSQDHRIRQQYRSPGQQMGIFTVIRSTRWISLSVNWSMLYPSWMKMWSL